MYNLVKNELIKIFSKKAIFITLLLFLALSIFVLGMQKYFENISVIENQKDITYLEEELNNIDISTDNGKIHYWTLKSEIETYQLANKYGGYSTWQGEMILEDVWAIKIDMNLYENGLDEFVANSSYTKEQIQKEYNKIIGRIEVGDWKSFVEEELEEQENQINSIKEQIKNTTDEDTKKELIRELEILKLDEQVNKWRLEKEIPYRDEKYDNTLIRYSICGKMLLDYNYTYNIDKTNYKEKVSDKFDYTSKISYQEALAEFEISKYRIENEIPNLESESVSSSIENLITNMGLLFILAISVMITGTIVSEEFNKGTIKLLLVRPYKRSKIMISKIIASLIAVLISIVAIVLIQTIVSGIGFGFNTIDIPVLKYNFNTNVVIEMNVFKWFIVNVLAVSPIIIIMSLLALMIGTIINNSACAIGFSMILYMTSSWLNQFAKVFGTKITWIKFIPFINWNLTECLYGKLHPIEGVTIQNSILTCTLFIVLLVFITLKNFSNKNIKNI